MKKPFIYILTLIFLFAFSGSVHGVGEKIITLGGSAAWNLAGLRTGITEIAGVRPHPVLVLSSAANSSAGNSAKSALDLSVSFDEGTVNTFRDSTNHYRVIASPVLEAVDRRFARLGTGAVLFPGLSAGNASAASNATSQGSQAMQGNAARGGPLVIEAKSRSALFAPDSHIRDFTIEFWLYPLNMENGEQILSWISSRSLPADEIAANMETGLDQNRYVFQRIQCTVQKSRLQWSFMDFFTSPGGIIGGGAAHFSITVSGKSPVVPKNWSHHLVRFDSSTGMLEYMVNGKTEAIEYASSTGHEGGEVYSPIAGKGGGFVLGGHFMGIMDEFKIHSAWINNPAVEKYPVRGGRMETRAIDLGEGNSGVLRVDALGGRTTLAGARISGEFQENGRFRFADDSEMQFFIRTADNPYGWDDSLWRSFTPGVDMPGPGSGVTIRGRYVQLAVDFYPSADGESSPYLEELRITYIPNDPPLPPASLVAVAVDGGVQLRWKNSPNTDTTGYLVYYGTSRDDYFSEDAMQGASPIDAGKRNTILIDGLANGTLYYFRVAAYDWRSAAVTGGFHSGEFSREVTARPLKGLADQPWR